MSKIVQTINFKHLLDESADRSPTTLVLTSYDEHEITGHLGTMFDLLTPLFETVVKSQKEYILDPWRLQCYSSVFLNPGPERMFASRTEVEYFRSFAERKLGARYFKEIGSRLDLQRRCPPPTAFVLNRNEGAGSKSIRNFDVVDRVFRRLKMQYRNVTIHSGTSSMEQIALFNTAGLIISSHSSQLKNLAFSTDHTIVLETIPTFFSTAFSIGTEFQNIVYVHSVGHRIDDAQIKEFLKFQDAQRKAEMRCDYFLDEHIFERDLLGALSRQRESCGNIWESDVL